MMKALCQEGYGSLEILKFRYVAKPEPSSGEVLVKMCATAINDRELGVLKTLPLAFRPMIGLGRPRGKFSIMGYDMAGVVEAVGRDVKALKPGDAVYGDLSGHRFGAFAEYVCVAEQSLAPKPAGMSFVQAAAIPHAAELALQALRQVPALEPNQHVLVNGAAGGVGTLLIQLLAPYQVETTGVDRAGKLDLLSSLGYDHVIEYPAVDLTRTGKQYDLIVDVKTSLWPSHYLRALRPGGSYITVGGDGVFRYVLGAMVLGQFSRKPLKTLALRPNRNLCEISALCESGRLEPVIDRVYPFAEIHQAFERFERADHQGKIIIEVAQPPAAA